MLRRLVTASLPVLALGGVLAIVIGSQSGRPRAAPPSARGAPHAASVHARPKPRLPLPPVAVRGAAARRMPVPILMYHVVAVPGAGTPNIGLWVTPAAFAAQMEALHREGYWAITLRQAWAAWTAGGPLPRKPVVVSFDDGYLGDYTHARPVLRRLGWPGVLNLELHNVGPRNLRASEVSGLIKAGWEIDSHTVDHPDMTTLSDARMRWELTASRRAIERRFGVRPEFFCYPAGRYDARVQAAVRAAGYRAATTEIEGYATGSNPFALPRVRVQGSDTAAALLARLTAERPAA
jgi:peptidoglycan/xylan/chitin deacetylase (PgdA/CDA1 family)